MQVTGNRHAAAGPEWRRHLWSEDVVTHALCSAAGLPKIFEMFAAASNCVRETMMAAPE